MIEGEAIVGESGEKFDSLVAASLGAKLDEASTDPRSRDDDESEFPPDDDIFDMVKEVDLHKPLASVTDRYFTAYYRMNFLNEGEDLCIRMHTNRLCMLSLAPSHAIFQNNRKIEKIDFQVTEKLNRADNAVSGKAKHGAQPLHESSKICTITCTNGETWTVRCGMNGKLTEANTDLLENPELLREPPHKGGYLAIVLPKIHTLEKLKKHLLTQDVYEATIRDRASSINSTNRINGTAKRSCDDDFEGFRDKMMKTEVRESGREIVDEENDSSV